MDDTRGAKGREIDRRVTVSPGQDGWRLDRASQALWPTFGLRGRRRLIEAGLALVNGRTRAAAWRVRAGDVLEAAAGKTPTPVFSPADIAVLADGADFGAVAKPGGLHSASLGPTGGESLEALLPAVFPGRPARLLSRLDRLTSGIVPVAFTEAAAARWRKLEDAGRVAKTYLAVVHGGLSAGLRLDRALDTDDRAVTRVLARATPDGLRHTAVTPEASLGGLTLVRCRIAKGARHQIRAHLAAAGHPLVGDPVYGHGEGARLFLHCAALESPVLGVTCPPPWELTTAMAVCDGETKASQDQF